MHDLRIVEWIKRWLMRSNCSPGVQAAPVLIDFTIAVTALFHRFWEMEDTLRRTSTCRSSSRTSLHLANSLMQRIYRRFRAPMYLNSVRYPGWLRVCCADERRGVAGVPIESQDVNMNLR